MGSDQAAAAASRPGLEGFPEHLREGFRRMAGADVALVVSGGTGFGVGGTAFDEAAGSVLLELVSGRDDGAGPVVVRRDGALFAVVPVSPVALLVAGPAEGPGAEAPDVLTAVEIPAEEQPAALTRLLDALSVVGKLYREVIEQSDRAYSALDQMTVLNTVGELVSREPDMGQAVQDILEVATELMDAESGSVMLIASDDPTAMRIAYAKGLPLDVVRNVTVKIGEGVSGHVAATGEPLLLRQGQRHHLSSSGAGLSSALCVPLRARDHVIGVLNIRDNRRGGNFSESDLHLAVTFASQAALAIENKRLVQKLSDRVEDTQAEVVEMNRDLLSVRERLQNIVRSIPNPVVVVDAADRLALMNRAAEEVLGLKPGLVLTRPLESALATTQPGRALAEALASADGAGDTPPEISIAGPGPRDYRVHRAPIRGTKGDDGCVVTLVDVTDLKELAELKSQVLSITSHELKTPLTAILGFARTLRDHASELDEESQHEFLSIVFNQATRLHNLVVNILDMARIEGGRPLDLKIEPTSIGEMLDSAVTAVREGTGATDYDFQVRIVDGIAMLELDRNKVEQVVINFLTNAVKYAEPGPVVVTAQREGDESIRISVTDRGRGIAPEELPTVFERWQRVGGQEHKRKAGHGLGLFLCKAFIEAHGGTIGVTSKVGVGSTFYFVVPVKAA